jgi:arginase
MRSVGLIGFPMDLGGNRRGVDMGPSAIRLAQLVEHLTELGIDVADMGNVIVHTRALIDEGDSSAHYLDEILRACEAAAQMTSTALDEGRVPVMLGGDHTVALGTLWGMARTHGPGGVIWIDAHADLNSPATTLSGNVHGMVLAAALDRAGSAFHRPPWPAQCVLPGHTVLIAARDLDPAEREALRSPGAPRVFTIADIDRRGMAAIAEEAVRIASGAGFLHVSLDLDSVDPKDAPGVGTPVRGGLSYREAHTLMEIIAEAPVSSLDVVEVNPVLDMRNATASLAAELTCSLFGKRIL